MAQEQLLTFPVGPVQIRLKGQVQTFYFTVTLWVLYSGSINHLTAWLSLYRGLTFTVETQQNCSMHQGCMRKGGNIVFILKELSDFQVTRPTPVSSRRVTSTPSARWTSGQGRRSVSAMLAISAWMGCPVRASVSSRPTSVSTMASVTSSLAREPSAGGWGLREAIILCAGRTVCDGRFTRPVLHLRKQTAT